MDLNQLFYHHQRAVMRAGARLPGSDASNCLVDHYARKIRERLKIDEAAANPSVWTPAVQ